MSTTPLTSDRWPATDRNAPALVKLVRGVSERSEGRIALLGALGCLGLLFLIFWPTLCHFVYVWTSDENYSHGFLVPLISLYFVNQAAERGPMTIRSGERLGMVLLAMSILGRLATVLVPVGFVGDLSFLLGLAGVTALIGGADVLRRFGFGISFLIFMVPLPNDLYARIASPLQLLVSHIASLVLNATNVPVLCEGNMMTLPGDVQMFVAEACSGMRQLTGFLALTTAVAYLSARPAWYRVTIVASSIPIAMTANVARVSLTGYIMYYLNPEYASGAYHTVEGLLLMALGLSLLRAECSVLDRLTASAEPAPLAAARA